MKKALEILKKLHNKDIWVMQQLKLEHIQVYEAIIELEEFLKLENASCEGCKYFRKSDKACFMSSQNTYIRPASIDFSGCGKHEPKDNK